MLTGIKELFDMLHGQLSVRWGRKSGCRWVRVRLESYWAWSPSLSRREFGLIEDHLGACPECRAEWEEVQEFRDWIEDQRRRLDPGYPDVERLADGVMARIAAMEADPATQPAIGGGWTRRWSYQLAAACLLLIALPVLGFVCKVVVSELRQRKNTASRMEPTKGDNGGDSRVHQSLTARPGRDAHSSIDITDILPDPLNSRLDLNLKAATEEFTLAAHAGAMLPRTEAQYERWARQEFPHVMWLHDELAKQGASPGWRKLLVQSGEIFRFDRPESADDANVKPRIAPLLDAARVAGFAADLVPDGARPLPELAWADPETAAGRMNLTLRRSAAGESAVRLAPEDQIPAAYFDRIGGRSTAKAVLVHVIVSSRVIGEPAFEDLAARTEDVLRYLVGVSEVPTAIPCSADAQAVAGRLKEIFQWRSELIRRRPDDRSGSRPIE